MNFVMPDVGEVYEIAKEFEWRINDFVSLSEESYTSPNFSFANESWYLRMYPDGWNSTIGYLSVNLCKQYSHSTISVEYSIGLKTADGKKADERQFTDVFNKGFPFYKPTKLLKKSELLEKKSRLMPSDVLTLFCSMENWIKLDAVNTTTLNCSYCKRAFLAKYASSHEKKCLDKSIKCATCNDAMKLREWFDHECQRERVEEIAKLMDDFGAILKNEEYSDVTIKVKDREFRLHKTILAGRSPFFRSMFSTEMKESITGIVSVEDCDPDIFESFVHFVYTGQIETLSSDKVCALYITADKFQDDQLKAKCLSFMKNKISVESFCDYIALALRHDEKELLQNATDLFCRKTKEIIQSVAWQTFLKENYTQANELFIKFVDFMIK